jgi:hypothetical protein
MLAPYGGLRLKKAANYAEQIPKGLRESAIEFDPAVESPFSPRNKAKGCQGQTSFAQKNGAGVGMPYLRAQQKNPTQKASHKTYKHTKQHKSLTSINLVLLNEKI